jgi:hypothetical protein
VSLSARNVGLPLEVQAELLNKVLSTLLASPKCLSRLVEHKHNSPSPSSDTTAKRNFLICNLAAQLQRKLRPSPSRPHPKRLYSSRLPFFEQANPLPIPTTTLYKILELQTLQLFASFFNCYNIDNLLNFKTPRHLLTVLAAALTGYIGASQSPQSVDTVDGIDSRLVKRFLRLHYHFIYTPTPCYQKLSAMTRLGLLLQAVPL